jgi:hypothetical protein
MRTSTSFTLFRRILDIVEERRKASTKPKPTAVFSFLQSVLANKFPDPGETITVRTFAAGGGASSSNGDVYQLTRSLGSRFEYLDYVRPYASVFSTHARTHTRTHAHAHTCTHTHTN